MVKLQLIRNNPIRIIKIRFPLAPCQSLRQKEFLTVFTSYIKPVAFFTDWSNLLIHDDSKLYFYTPSIHCLTQNGGSKFTAPLITTFYMTKAENRTKKLIHLSDCCFKKLRILTKDTTFSKKWLRQHNLGSVGTIKHIL